MKATFRVRLDPWEPEYEGSIQLADEPEQLPDVDLQVELSSWVAVQPSPAPLPEAIFFVDGVRRIEHRLLVEAEERTLYGLVGSFAVGATRVTSRADIVDAEVRRIVAVGGGLELPTWRLPLATACAELTFEGRAAEENTPEAPLLRLQNSMREAEAQLANKLSADDSLVFLDGTLSFFTASRRPVVGFVKRLMRSYLASDASRMLASLLVGQRTPIFLIKETRHQRYSWYGRIASGRSIDSVLTGIVRLETSSSLDLQLVRRLADCSTLMLPRFASARGHDPRAPQNLYPIAGLEAFLRHRLGDTLVIRRAIESYLHAQEVAA